MFDSKYFLSSNLLYQIELRDRWLLNSIRIPAKFVSDTQRTAVVVANKWIEPEKVVAALQLYKSGLVTSYCHRWLHFAQHLNLYLAALEHKRALIECRLDFELVNHFNVGVGDADR